MSATYVPPPVPWWDDDTRDGGKYGDFVGAHGHVLADVLVNPQGMRRAMCGVLIQLAGIPGVVRTRTASCSECQVALAAWKLARSSLP